MQINRKWRKFQAKASMCKGIVTIKYIFCSKIGTFRPPQSKKVGGRWESEGNSNRSVERY